MLIQLTGEKKNTQKHTQLSKKRDTLNEKLVKIEEEMIGSLFTNVFAHRYRDTFPDIRSACVEELGIWISRYPQLFLDESYLKYLGWTLNDRVPEVRASAVKVLSTHLYKDAEHVEQLENFTKRFRDRILEIATRDVDIEVQALGCELATEMSR